MAQAEGVSGSLALCVIDSVQSIGVNYASGGRVIDGYRAYRTECHGEATTDGTPDLIATFDQLGCVDGWIERIGNRNRTFSRSLAPLKAEVIHEAAKALDGADVQTAEDFRKAIAEHAQELKTIWLNLPSQRSGISWRHLQMMA